MTLRTDITNETRNKGVHPGQHNEANTAILDHETRIAGLEAAPPGSGAVASVNGQTGIVVLDAADVGALTEVAGDARYWQLSEVLLHADLPDLATSGHPGAAISLDPTGLVYVNPSSSTLPEFFADHDAAIGGVYLHANLVDTDTDGHPGEAVAIDDTGFVHISGANAQEIAASTDTALGSITGSSVLFSKLASDGPVRNNTQTLIDSGLTVNVDANTSYWVTTFLLVDASFEIG